MIRIFAIVFVLISIITTSHEYFAFAVITAIFISINIVVFFVYRAKSVILLSIIILIIHYQILSYADHNVQIASEISETIWIPLCLMSIVISIYYLLFTRTKAERNVQEILPDKEGIDIEGFFILQNKSLKGNKKTAALTKFEYVVTFILGIATNFAYDGLVDITKRILQS